MKRQANLDPCAVEDATRSRNRRHSLFCSPDYGSFAAPIFSPCRSNGDGGVAKDQCGQSRFGAKPGAIRRRIDWILLVFPLWVLSISIYILIDNLRNTSRPATTNKGTNENLTP
jgi:hypothetical protein